MSHHDNREEEGYVFHPTEIGNINALTGEFEHVFRRKCNTAAAAKEREIAWENTGAWVSA